ncbi:acyltransferase [Mobilitalea sibirica]|uniref:Acyltransferase n=1 Tax=Mobilitalea sibirica TaxID=1462919 RepID=A0A8J7KUU9_9FIRM|nr:acyltransferase [Mobilitalea sibirica]MBH1939415.1 acyltransferase [Mobilitalea sibirica]
MGEAKRFDERAYLFIVKAFALFSIVSAHVGTVPKATFPCNQIFGLVLDSIGAIGVGVFFFISGYLFYDTKRPLQPFFRKKAYTIGIPWLFCGTLLFLYVALRKGGLDFYHWFLTITAYSHLYYLSVLMMLYLMFWKGKNNIRYLFILMGVSYISIELTGLNYLTIYPYINPLNWAIYFVIGSLIRRFKLLCMLSSLCLRWLPVLILFYIAVLSVNLHHGEPISYWMKGAIPVEMLSIGMVLGLSAFCMKKKIEKLLIMLGQMSFAVYLLHTPFAGIITNLCNRYQLWYLTPVRPVMVLLITILAIKASEYVSKRIGMNKIVEILIGIRQTK